MESPPDKLYADGIDPVRRSRLEEVFFIQIVACPAPGSDEFGHEGGAYVACYVDADDLRTAELRAISLIQQQGWQPQCFDSWQLTCAECASDEVPEGQADGPTPRDLVRQALTDGEACAFFCWPIDAPDADKEDV